MKIKINNCNNIDKGDFTIIEEQLNIRYALNGTGKSTIGQAIQLNCDNKPLVDLRTFGSKLDPSIELSSPVKKVYLFNEAFVSTVVFKESNVIENAFEVFIQSEDYIFKQKIIDSKLEEIHIDTTENEDIGKLYLTGQQIIGKFTLTASGELKNTGLIKNITTSENIFSLPDLVKKYQPLMDKEYNVSWVTWKNEGSKYDDTGLCPFCTEILGENYENEKQVFTDSYSKSNVQSIKDILAYFESLKDYINIEKYNILTKNVKEAKDESATKLWITRFYIDLKYLIDKIRKVIEFNSFKVKSEELSKLESQLRDLLIDENNLQVFNNDCTLSLIKSINSKVEKLIGETESLKKEIGSLKGLIGAKIKQSTADINDFLDMAGINYKLFILHESKDDTKAILKYVNKSKDEIPVDNIKMHLSWGERNAFALVLFMHSTFKDKSDLIILDDPISSFDSTKKYAIINRLFLNKPTQKSFYKQTVLMLTHDFQPVIDFIVNNKPNGGSSNAFFLKNKDGILNEYPITNNDIKSLPIMLAENSSCESINIVHRVICFRKLLEHTKQNRHQFIAYNLLSCLLKGKDNALFADEKPIDPTEIELAESYIKTSIKDFCFTTYCSRYFNLKNLVSLYKTETNNYFKLQIFRIIIAIANLRSQIEDPLLKYIDEQFHVENDYIYYLDFTKFDIVPDFVIPKCEDFLVGKRIL
jgi:ABC-type dipeptide/oligopeptide/nickel transport system ATPase component